MKWYQAIKCEDGRQEHDYLFGRYNEGDGEDWISLGIMRTSHSYQRGGLRSTWSYPEENCNFIIEQE